ncbi:MAG TPA: hypothetical protein VGG67_04615 [Steroidobacteraceae bacterium]
MSDNRKRQSPQDATSSAERRRIGKVVHDDRGNASVEWQAAPVDHERQVLEVAGEAGIALKREEVSYDPYACNRPRKAGGAKRTDLRKLGEWIKQMRELEERRRNGGENGTDEE